MKKQAAFPVPERIPAGPPWRLIAFDLDDTLYPEIEYVRSGFWEVALWSAKHLDFEAERTFAELIELFDEGIRGSLFDSWIATHGLSTNLTDEMVKTYREHYPRIHLF